MASARNIAPIYQVIWHFTGRKFNPLCHVLHVIKHIDFVCLSGLGAPHIMHNLQSFASAMSRRLLREAGNLPALSGNDLANSKEIPRPVDVLSLGSGSFSAFPKSNGPLLPESVQNVDPATVKQLSAAVTQSADKESSGAKYSKWIYVLIFPAAILLIVVPILICRKQGHASMGPWRTGLSGPLQKAFVTGKQWVNTLSMLSGSIA
jgi:hypothetical protein